MIDFKSNDEITQFDIFLIHYYVITLYEEMLFGRYDKLDKTIIKNRIMHLCEIVEK